jgi:hypothetical protein
MTGLKKPSSVDGLRAAATARTAPIAAPVSVAGDQVPVVVKPVRISFDVDREIRNYLKRFALDADSDVIHVLRALVSEMQADADLADRVRARLGQGL